MSETSEDKTKRRYLEELLHYQWTYQIFLYDLDDPLKTKEKFNKAKRYLSKNYPDHAILVRVQLKQNFREETLYSYLSCFTTFKPSRADVIQLEKIGLNYYCRAVTHYKKASIASAIWNQRPHTPSSYFEDIPIKRWTILNASRLETTPLDNSEVDDIGYGN